MSFKALFAILLTMFLLTSCLTSALPPEGQSCVLNEDAIIRQVQAYNIGEGVSLERAIEAVISGMRIAGRDVEVRNWQATCVSKDTWRVACRMRYSDEARIAQWHYNEQTGAISAQNILGQDFLNIVTAR